MEVIRNLSGVQKGLLAGLVLGILAVYFCLCLSAVGIVPVSLPGLSQSVAQAPAEATLPPTATSMSGIPTEAVLPEASSEPENEPDAAVASAEAADLETPEPAADTAVGEATPSALALKTEKVLSSLQDEEVGTMSSLSPGTPARKEMLPTLAAQPTASAGASGAESVEVRVLSDKSGEPTPKSPAPILSTRLDMQVPQAAASTPTLVVIMSGKNAASETAPTPEWTWQGVEVERKPGSVTGASSTVLAVRVFGVPSREVYVRETTSGLSTTLVTGRKPQYGDYSDDIGGLPPATYGITVDGIDAGVEVTLEPGDFVLLEFALRPPTGSVSGPVKPAMTVVTVTQGTPVVQKESGVTPEKAVLPAAASTGTPVPPAKPAATQPAGSIVADPAATASAMAGWTWQGVVYEQRTGTGSPTGTIAVRVVEVPDRKVRVRELSGTWETTLVTGRKPEYGPFSDDVGGLGPGTYAIKPMDIDSEVTVNLGQGDFVLVEFALRPVPGWTPETARSQAGPEATALVPAQLTTPAPAAPPAPAQEQGQIVADPAATESAKAGWTWQGIVYEQRTDTGDPVGIIAVRVVEVPDRKVFVKEVGGTWETTLVTGRKPEYGRFSDDVGGLGPGTYSIKPMDIDSEVSVTLSRGDSVLVEFALRPAPGTTPVSGTAQPPAPVAPAIQPTQAAASQPPVQAGGADPAATISAQMGWTWQGLEYERKPGTVTGNSAGTIAVRVVEVPDRKVAVKELSGTWETTLVTGQKSEYGRFADAVGGLSPGTYVIKPMDIDSEVSVKLESGDFVLVEFALRPVPGWTPPAGNAVLPAPEVQATSAVQLVQPAAPPQPAQGAVPDDSGGVGSWSWQGVEYERKYGQETGNIAGVIAVRVVGVPDRKVFVKETSGGWESTLTTGNKPEYGEFSDAIGGLPAGTYTIKPMDIDDDVTISLGKGDFVLVEFALRPEPGWVPGQPGVVQGSAASSGLLPTPTLVPGWTWEGREVERKAGVQTGNAQGKLVVRAIALPDWQATVSDLSGSWAMPIKLERHAEYGNFAGVVEGLAPGTFVVYLAGGVGAPAQVTVGQGDFVLLEFFPRPAQP